MSIPSSKQQVTNAGIIIIGDEILKGQTLDTNTHFLTQNLHRRGIRVVRVSVIPDDIETISSEVKTFSEKYDFVLTSGGIGPTHDDVTFEGVAKAFDCQTEHNERLVSLCKAWFKKDNLDDPCFKLALLPSLGKLNFGIDKKTNKPMLYPIVSVRNVYIFPGIPELLKRSYSILEDELFQTDTKFFTKEVFLSTDELSLTSRINKLVIDHPQVTFGSYPSWSNQYYKTKIALEALEQSLVDEAISDIREKMSPLDYDPSPAQDAYEKIRKFANITEDASLRDVINKSVEIVEECFTKYNPESVSVCFNGGKDCIAMLHIVHAVHQKLFPEKKLKSFYVSEKKTFSEVDEFIEKAIEMYGLVTKTYEEPMKTALGRMLEDDTEVEATMLGVRIGDPGSKYVSYFSPTDGDWPRVMRVHPVLDWSFPQVWAFIRGLSLPYPSLYDQGYTSLGNPDNTRPNPALAYTGEAGEQRHRPAYMLEDTSLERMGRS